MSRMSLELFSLKGTLAIVTGAGRGLGKAMALGLAEAGSDIAIPELVPERGEETAAEIRRLGRRAIVIKTDVTKVADIMAMAKSVQDEFGRIDVLVNNAGIARTGKVPEELDEESWGRNIDVNLTGVFSCCRHVGQVMIRQRHGVIINIASMSGLVVNKERHVTDYCAAKGGVIMLTKALASEWARYGIRVNAIAPGYFRTALTAEAFADPKISGPMFDWTPMKRPGEVEELKGPVVFLASDASSYMTGHVLVCDGGYTIW